jgi:hypothetical protein
VTRVDHTQPGKDFRPALARTTAGELALSGPALVELMRGVLRKGAAFRFKARGGSMGPFIRNGDIVTVAPLGPGPLRVGDVMAFTGAREGDLRVHRVVASDGDALIAKGDNVSGPDGSIPPAQVLGVVRSVERDDRSIRIGLGPERGLIAILSRTGWLLHLLQPIRRLRQLVDTSRRRVGH